MARGREGLGIAERIMVLQRRTSHVVERNKENIMNEDQVQGRIEEAKGEVKKFAGKASGNRELAKEGKLQKAHGKAQAKFGDVMDEISKA